MPQPSHDRFVQNVKHRKACVIGAGPNDLAVAIVLAQAGLKVEVFEAESQPGGAARNMELTLPGFHHDFGSAVHPMAAGSPFFSALPLADYGLEWIHSPVPLAHPMVQRSCWSGISTTCRQRWGKMARLGAAYWSHSRSTGLI
jgi:phytoene dehydrogenase-like protein